MSLPPEWNIVLGLLVFSVFFRLPDLIRLTLHRLCSRRKYIPAWFAAHFILGGLGAVGAFLTLTLAMGRGGFLAGFWAGISLSVLLMSLRTLFNAIQWLRMLRSRRK